MKPYAFGNELVYDQQTSMFFVNATGEVLDKEVYKTLVCPKCDKNPTPEGHDPCIANLPGVDFACCGHGVKDGYVKFNNGIILKGEFDHCQSIESIFNKEG